jgi:MoaA/NifB/PqqE/SkfB family radical SAM enzyme/thioredoxin-like negative regulator of GroEL
MEQDNFEKALELFALNYDNEYKNLALLETGKIYKMQNNPLKAIDFFISVISRNNKTDEFIKELTETAILSGHITKALKCLLRENAPLETAKLYLALNDFLNAEKFADIALQDSRLKNEALLLKAKILSSNGYLTKALALLNQLPVTPDIAAETGNIYYQKGNYKKALEYYEIAAQNSEDKNIFLKLVDLYYLTGNMEKSEIAGQKAVALAGSTPFDKDVMLNKLELLQRKTVLKSKMKRLWVSVTTRCNIRCKTCGLWKQKWDLPYKTAKEVMDNYPYLERLVWLGGEVFFYEHFEEMFDKAGTFPNLKQQVITNGIALTPKWIEKIMRTENAELTFSIDGTTKEVYEEIRQGSNFEKLLEVVRLTMKTKKDLGVKKDIRMNSVIMRTNYNQIYDLLNFAHREGFNQVSLMALHFDSAPGENIFDNKRDNRHILKYLSDAIPVLRKRAKEYNIDLDILLPVEETFDKAVENAQSKHKETDNSLILAAQPKDLIITPPNKVCCTMPWNYMMLCDDGNVLLTGSCIKSVGNIYHQSLSEIWNSTEAQKYRQMMIDKNFDENYCRLECTGRW